MVDTGGMSKAQQERREFWRHLIAQQEQDGVTVRAFSGAARRATSVKFALAETNRGVPPRLAWK